MTVKINAENTLNDPELCKLDVKTKLLLLLRLIQIKEIPSSTVLIPILYIWKLSLRDSLNHSFINILSTISAMHLSFICKLLHYVKLRFFNFEMKIVVRFLTRF